MNDLTCQSAPSGAILSLPISVKLRHHIERLTEPPNGVPRPAVADAERQEAEMSLATVGPLRMVGLGWFSDWLEPLFMTAGSRASSPADRLKQTAVLWDLVSDMPEEVFTPASRRAVAAVSEFMPTAKRIRDVLGADAAKVIAYHAALVRLAQPPSPSPAAPACPSVEEIAKEALDIQKMVKAFKVDIADRHAPPTAPEPSKLVKSFAVTPVADLARMRASNPLVQAASAQAGPRPVTLQGGPGPRS